MLFSIQQLSPSSRARVGILETPHGRVETPAFLPIAPQASADSLTPANLLEAGTELLAVDVLALSLGRGLGGAHLTAGLHEFMGWSGPLLALPGGGLDGTRVASAPGGTPARRQRLRQEDQHPAYRVVGSTEESLRLKSTLDGAMHSLTLEQYLDLQLQLGVDILSTLVPLPVTDGREGGPAPEERFRRWAERCAARYKAAGPGQPRAIFGTLDLRSIQHSGGPHMQGMASFPFQGFILMDSRDSGQQTDYSALREILDVLPADRPRCLARPLEVSDLLKGVAQGIDLFASFMPLGLARCGRLLIRGPKLDVPLDLKDERFAQDQAPVDAVCRCYACRCFNRAYLHHLFRSGEISGIRLAALHNLHTVNVLMSEIRSSIKGGSFRALP